MVDATTAAVIIAVSVVLLGLVMFIMICKQTKQQNDSKRRISQRELRRKSRIFSIVSHRHATRFFDVTPRSIQCNVSDSDTSHVEAPRKEQSSNNTDSNSDKTADTCSSRGQEEGQQTTIPVSIPSPSNHDNPTQTQEVKVDHASVAPTITDSRQDFMNDYKPARLPPIDPAPVIAEYKYPDEVRGNDET